MKLPTIQLRNAAVAAAATVLVVAAMLGAASGGAVNDDWPEGAMLEGPGEIQLPPPEPEPSPGGPSPSSSPPPGDDEAIAVVLVVTVESWEIPAPPDPTPSPTPVPTITSSFATAPAGAAQAQVQQVRCRTARAAISALNIFRATLWTYEMEVDWCWNGARVTNTVGPRIAGNVVGWAGALGWSYDGVRNMNGPADRFGNQWVYRTYSQGAFSYAPPPKIWNIQKIYPRLWIDVDGGGTSRTWSAS